MRNRKCKKAYVLKACLGYTVTGSYFKKKTTTTSITFFIRQKRNVLSRTRRMTNSIKLQLCLIDVKKISCTLFFCSNLKCFTHIPYIHSNFKRNMSASIAPEGKSRQTATQKKKRKFWNEIRVHELYHFISLPTLMSVGMRYGYMVLDIVGK